MKLSEVLPTRNVVVPLTGGSLPAAAANLLDHAVAEVGASDAAWIKERLDEWRSEDMVALSERAFIMHMRTDAVKEIILIAGVAPEPICRELGETEPQCARLAFLLLAPPRRAAEYLQMLGALGRFLSKPEAAEEFIAHAGPDALSGYLESTEFELPKQLRVRDIMVARPRTTAADASLRDAARDMVKSGLGGLVAVDSENRVVGLLGEKELMRDLLTNYLQGGTANRDAPASTGRRKVRDVMTRQVLGVSPDQPLAEIASIMVNKDVERVPVVEDGQLVGVLTRADIVRKLIGN